MVYKAWPFWISLYLWFHSLPFFSSSCHFNHSGLNHLSNIPNSQLFLFFVLGLTPTWYRTGDHSAMLHQDILHIGNSKYKAVNSLSVIFSWTCIDKHTHQCHSLSSEYFFFAAYTVTLYLYLYTCLLSASPSISWVMWSRTVDFFILYCIART